MNHFSKSRQFNFLMIIVIILLIGVFVMYQIRGKSNGIGLNVESAGAVEGKILPGYNFYWFGVLPISSVIAYMSPTIPPYGWLECDGSALNSSEYPELYTLIGQMYGDGSYDNDLNTDFNLPDLRGYFLRGWDHNLAGEDDRQVVDPDRKKKDMGIGTIQKDAFQGHQHRFSYKDRASKGSNRGIGWDTSESRTAVHEPTVLSGYGSPRISSETRPVNISVMYIIRVK